MTIVGGYSGALSPTKVIEEMILRRKVDEQGIEISNLWKVS